MKAIRIWLMVVFFAFAGASQAAPFVYVPVWESIGGAYEYKLAIIDDAGQVAATNSPTLDGSAKGIAISSDGARVYAVVPGATYPWPWKLQVLDTSTNTIIASVDLGGDASSGTFDPQGVALTPDNATAYVALPDGLRIVDTRTLTQTGNVVAAAGNDVAWANGTLWVTYGNAQVAVYDPAANTTTNIDSGAGAHYLKFVTANSDGSKIVACGTSGNDPYAPWVAVDTANNSFTLGATPVTNPYQQFFAGCRIKSSGGFYITAPNAHAVEIFSSVTGALSGGIPIGSDTYPNQLDFTPDESRLYVFPFSKSYVSVVNLADSSVSQSSLPANTTTNPYFAGRFIGPATVADITPNQISFAAASNAVAGSLVVSNVATITGLGATDRSPVAVVNGTYYYSSDNGQTWVGPTAAALAVANGDQLKVAATASGAAGAVTTASLYVGGIKSDFVVTTQTAQPATASATTQTIGTISFSPATLNVGGTSTVSATASSGLSVTFSSLTTGTCTVSGSTVTGVAAGACTIAADQAGDANYAAAPQATQNITIGTADQAPISDARVFAFAEANFPSLFAGAATAGEYQLYNYRYYPASGNFLAIDTAGVIYVLGTVTGGALTTVGPVESFRSYITAWEAAP